MQIEQKDFERKSLLVTCAKLFYEEKLSKAEIAKKLNISAMQVTRIIRKAEASGIVKIEIDAHPDQKKLEKSLQNKYDLLTARIVEFTKDYDVLRKRLGEIAAQVFEGQLDLRVKPKVGIGGGGSIYEMVKALEQKPRNISIYPMGLLGRGPEITYFESTYLATLALLKSQPVARAFIVGVPPLPDDNSLAKSFSKQLYDTVPEIRQVLKGSRNVDLAFVGLGSFLIFDEVIKELSKVGMDGDVLKKMGAIGGINYNYFDIQGKQIGGDFLLTVSVNDLKKLSKDKSRLICLVAGGDHKLEAIKVAIEKKMVNSIVTDSLTAENLIFS